MLGAVIAVLFLLLGLILQRIPSFPLPTATTWINGYLLNLVLPALALLHIPQILPSLDLLLPISAAWFTFLLSWVLFGLIGKIFSWEKSTTGCLIIVSGLANTSFLGFPVLELLYGKEALSVGLLIDQGGSFLLVSSLAILVASIYSHQEGDLRSIPLKILKFPPFGFLIATILMSILGWKTPEFLLPVLSLVGKTMAPMALLALGIKFSLDTDALNSRYYWMSIGYRLILAPAFVWIIYRHFLPSSELMFKTTVLESGMAPMITGSIVAIQYNLQPKLATLLASLGIPISLVTVMIWYWFLG
jgi:predicted permease